MGKERKSARATSSETDAQADRIVIKVPFEKGTSTSIHAYVVREVPDGAGGEFLLVGGLPTFYGDKTVRFALKDIADHITHIESGHFAKAGKGTGAFYRVHVDDDEVVSTFFEESGGSIALKLKDKSEWEGQPSTFDTFVENRVKRRPNQMVLQKEVDSFMLAFDEKEKEDFNNAKRESKLVDEDGFTVVTRKKGRGIAAEQPTLDAEVEEESKKKRDKILKSFYRFQRREARVAEMEKLREKFEEDKARIAKLKESRKFKPY